MTRVGEPQATSHGQGINLRYIGAQEETYCEGRFLCPFQSTLVKVAHSFDEKCSAAEFISFDDGDGHSYLYSTVNQSANVLERVFERQKQREIFTQRYHAYRATKFVVGISTN